ncbi:MAG TPA: hypothetical protein VNV25_00540 [Gemmatimonadaceae bacterium]|jgi:hypothetical protein|nr:hypothetical protein [Gemmatimonadaceae bacterium]
MSIKLLYALYASAVVALAGIAEARGWSALPVDEIKNVPHSVRENPGAYRTVYASSAHYLRGK